MSTATKMADPGLLSRQFSRRALLTASTAASLYGMQMLYALSMRPLVAAPTASFLKLTRISLTHGRPLKNVEFAKKYLPEYPWAAKAKYQHRTEDAFIYFEEMEPVDLDDPNSIKSYQVVRFKPFAMIWLQKGRKEGEKPITIYSESAYVKFASKFDLYNPNPGRVVGGAMERKVTITGPDQLLLTGENFYFTEGAKRIWCDSDVDFVYQKHRGTARGLQLELIPDEAARQANKLSVSGIKSIHLLRDVSMDLVFEPGEGEKNREPQDVKIRSKGSFNFVLNTNVATFEKNVNVRAFRRSKPRDFDSLNCDLLTLVFEKEDSKKSKTKTARVKNKKDGNSNGTEKPNTQRFQLLGSSRSFQRLNADGRKVVLLSSANNMTAVMTRFGYDAQSKVAELTNTKGTVQVDQKGSRLLAPKITLVHDDDGKVTDVHCSGPGRLRRVDTKTGEEVLTARWKKELRRFPDTDTGFDIIELEEQAVLQQPGRGVGLAADLIRLWVDPQKAQNSPQSTDLVKQTAGGASDDETANFRPRRMLGIKNVTMVAPDLYGQTERLEVWFQENESDELDKSDELKGTETSSVRSRQAVGQTVIVQNKRSATSPRETNSASSAPGFSRVVSTGNQPIVKEPGSKQTRPSSLASSDSPPPSKSNHPDSSGQPKQNTNRKDKKKTEGPAIVKADLIRVLVSLGRTQKDTRVAELWTNGKVDVKQEHLDGREPLHLTADTVHMVNRTEGEEIVHVYGNPANIHDAGMHIEAANIHFNRNENKFWVKGAGLLELPVKENLEGKKLLKPELLSVWWKERMKFDGETAEFFRDTRTELGDNLIRCQEMLVRMDKKVQFGQRDKSGTIKIENIVCKDGVEFDSYTYKDNKLVEVRKGWFAELTMNRLTGDTTGRGPGHIISWQRGRGRRAALTPSATVQANKPKKSDAFEWEYSRVDFARNMRGNINRKQTTFYERVEIVYGPVELPPETIDPDALPEDGAWMNCDKLRVTQVKDPATATDYIKLLARGNSELTGQTFTAHAHEVSFDESTGLYVLRARGHRDVTMYRQVTPGGEQGSWAAQNIRFYPAKNEVNSDRTSYILGVDE